MWLLTLSLFAVQVGPPLDLRLIGASGVTRMKPGDTVALPDSTSDRLRRLEAATAARMSYRYDAAAMSYASLLDHAPDPPDRITLSALLGQSELRLATAPLDQAIAAFTLTAAVARTLADTATWVKALIGIGFARSRMERPSAGLPELELAAQLLPPDSLALGAALQCTRGTVLVQGQDPAAMAAATRGLALAREARDSRREAFCLRVLGSHSAYSGDVPAAVAALDSAAAIQRAVGDRLELGSTLRWKGWLLLQWHDFPAADRLLTEARMHGGVTGPLWSVGWTLRHQAALAWRLGELGGALQLLDSAEAILTRQKDEWGVVSVRGLRGDIALDAGRPGEAEAGFRAQIAFGERVGRPIEVYTGLLGLMHLRMRQRDWDGASEMLAALRRHVRDHGQPGWDARLDYEAGVLALQLAQPSQAWQAFSSYLAKLSPGDHLALHAAHTRRAGTLVLRKDFDGAIAELHAAALALDRYRAELANDHLRLLAFQSHQAYDDDAGFASVISAMVEAGRADVALGFAEQRRARVLGDRIRIRTGESGSIPDAVGRLRAALPASTALLFLHGGRRGQPTTVFLVQRGGVNATRAPGIEELEALGREFISVLRGGTIAMTAGGKLRAALLDALLPHLAPSVTQLLIVPDGEMFRLPFDALPLPDGRPLVTRFAVSLSPSATVAAELLLRPRRDDTATALALGDAVFPSLDPVGAEDPAALYRETFRRSGGLPRLRASADEARHLVRLAPESVMRLRQDASEAWLRHAALGRYRLIHLASHAVVSEQSVSRTALALAPGDGEDGFLGVADIADLKLEADLVVLSACRTAGGVVVGGEGIQGFVAPLLGAGARSVLATRWQVGDRAAARFIEKFYRALASGETAVAALRSARLASLVAGTPPDEWAAFVLVGDPEVRLPLRVPRRPVAPVLAALFLAGLAGYGVIRSRRGRESSVVPS